MQCQISQTTFNYQNLFQFSNGEIIFENYIQFRVCLLYSLWSSQILLLLLQTPPWQNDRFIAPIICTSTFSPHLFVLQQQSKLRIVLFDICIVIKFLSHHFLILLLFKTPHLMMPVFYLVFLHSYLLPMSLSFILILTLFLAFSLPPFFYICILCVYLFSPPSTHSFIPLFLPFMQQAFGYALPFS